MPLSTQKLEILLNKKGIIISNYYTIESLIVFIEVMNINSGVTFFIYVPSKYKFPPRNNENVYKLKYLDIDEEENKADNYTGDLDQNELENKYEQITLGVTAPIYGQNIAPHLEESYKRNINLKNVSNNNMKHVKDNIRQLKRLRLCVQNVKYKLAIVYKNFISYIRRDDSVESLVIKNFQGKNYKQLYVTVDLETLYEKLDCLILNITDIRTALYNVLDKNHFTHTNTLQKLMDNKRNLVFFSKMLI